MNNYTFKFKIDNPSSSDRKTAFENIIKNNPNKLPIICEKHPEENELEELTTTKLVIPDNTTLNDLKNMVEKNLNLPFNIDLFHNNEILENMPIKEVFEKYKDPEDNFIYVYFKKSLNKTKQFKFKKNLSTERIQTYKLLSKKYPDKIPVICEKDPDCDDLEEVNKTKYIVNKDWNINQILFLLKEETNFSSEICLKINDEIIDESEITENVYEKYKDKEDNFLYCFYSKKISNSQSNSFRNSQSSSLSNSFEIEEIDYEFQFKKKTFEDRKNTFKKLIIENPKIIPVVCEKHPKSKLKQLDKSKYLINNKMTLNEFKLEIKKNLLEKNEIFIFFKDKFINSNLLMSELYKKYKDEEDNFLYCFYSETDDFSTKFNDNNEEKNNDYDDNESYEYDDENNSFEYKDDDDD